MKTMFFQIIIFQFFSSILFAQNEIDSLNAVLKSTKEDTNKVNLLSVLYGKYLRKGIYDTAYYFSHSALKLAEKLNFKNGIAEALNSIGNLYYERGIYDSSLQYNFNALKLREEIGNKKNIARSYSDIGNIYKRQNRINKAMEYYMNGLKLYEESRDKRGIALSLTNVGTIHRRKGESQKALGFYLESLQLLQEISDSPGIAMCMNNIGNIYFEHGKPEMALDFQIQSLKIKEKSGDKRGIAISLVNIFQIHAKMGNYELARFIAEKALNAAREIDAKDLIRELYFNLSKVLAEKGNFKDAYKYHIHYSEIKDTVLNAESSRQITEMQTKYDTEKKELRIENLNKDNAIKETEIKKQNFQKLAFASGFSLMLILAFIIFRGYKQKQRANVIISLQKTEVEKQKEIVDEKNQSLEVAYKHIEEKNTEILDSIRYAKRIQDAILPPQKLVKQYLEESFILYKPKDIVAGDFYWMHSIDKISALNTVSEKKIGTILPTATADCQLILFAACDCTGHGVPGSFVSIVAHNALNRAVKEFGLIKPSDILDKTNELVEDTFSKSENEMKDGMDIAICSLELPSPNGKRKEVRLQYAGANNSIYLIRKRELTEIKADKQPIGFFIQRKPFTNHEIMLLKNDSIYAFSDGYADQFGGPKGKKFKYKQFENLLLSIQDNSMSEQRKILNENINNWRGELEQIDDICVMGVRIG